MVSNVCLVCNRYPKQREHQFCSQSCADRVASSPTPCLLPVPSDHHFFQKQSRAFFEHWNSKTKRPQIVRMFLITWPSPMRASFEGYRESVLACRRTGKAPEQRCFRSERRACMLGDHPSPQYTSFCRLAECRLCRAIESGFASSLNYKCEQVRKRAKIGHRFGGGVYLTPDSNKAYDYARDLHDNSKYKTVLITRTVMGRKQHLKREQPDRMQPDPGFDSVTGIAEGGVSEEYVVYDKDAVRPAYLLVLKE